MTIPTTPIPEQRRHPAPNPAPNRPTECPRCGAPAISTRGVGTHDLWHREQDTRNRKLDALIDALEEMLSAFDGDPDEHGDRKTFRDWVAETDQILDRQQAAIEQLRDAITSPDREAAAEPEVEVLPWPGDPAPEQTDDTPAATVEQPTAGEPDPDLDGIPRPTAISDHLAARDGDLDLDDGDDYVDLPGSRY